MGNRRWIAAVVLAITGSLLGAPAAAATPLTHSDDEGLLPPIEIRIPGLLELRIGGAGSTEEPPADDPEPPPTPQPTPTATPTPTPTAPPPPVEADPVPEPEPPAREPDAATTDRRENSRVGTPSEASAASGISRSAPTPDWPTVDATVQVGPESISVSRVRIDDAVTSALSYAAGGLGLLAAGAAVARWRLLARAGTSPRHRGRDE